MWNFSCLLVTFDCAVCTWNARPRLLGNLGLGKSLDVSRNGGRVGREIIASNTAEKDKRRKRQLQLTSRRLRNLTMFARIRDARRAALQLSKSDVTATWQRAFSDRTGREGTSAEELSSDPNMAPPKDSQSASESGKGATEGHQTVPSEQEVEEQGRENEQDTDKSSVQNASGDPSKEDQRAFERGPTGGIDDSPADSESNIERNEAADDPSSETAQKFTQTSSDEKDMGASS